MQKKPSATAVHERGVLPEIPSTTRALNELLRGRESLIDNIPSIPAILHSLLEELELPPMEVDLVRIADLISRDKSIAAQCLRMANSPVFGRGQYSDSLRGAVLTLGISNISDIVMSCSIMRVGSSQRALDPAIFWEHSLGCALLSRRLARSVRFHNPEKAYLAGLLHDIGYIVNLVLAPDQMKMALQEAAQKGLFFGEVELSRFGFSHCESGELLAQKWHFAPDIMEVIQCHHEAASAVVNPALVAIVALADRICRSSNLGLGYMETKDPASDWQSDWDLLAKHCPGASQMNWFDFAIDSASYVGEIRNLVAGMLKLSTA